MKAGWDVATLSDLARIELGKTPARKSAANWDGEKTTDNVWITISDMPRGVHSVVTTSKEHVSDLAVPDMKLVPKGTLLLSFKLSIGKVVTAGRDLYTNEAIAALHDLDETRILKAFLYWTLVGYDWDNVNAGEDKVKGRTLNKKILKVLPIPVPPLAEQRRIVAMLDEAFAKLEGARENVEASFVDSERLSDVVLRRTFDDLKVEFPDALFRLEEVADLRGGYAFKSKEYVAEGVFVLRTLNISKSGEITKKNAKYVSESSLDKYESFLLKSGDTLFVMVGATLGKTGYVRNADLPALLNQNMWVIRAKGDNSNHSYLNYVFQAITQDAVKEASGTARSFLRRDNVRHLHVVMPDNARQEEVVARLDMIQKLNTLSRNKMESQLSELTDLRKSLLQRAFAGDLT